MISILETIVAGIVGTALMTALMTLVNHSGWARADMIRALGSLATRSYENSVLPGLVMHFAAGAILAFPYVFILSGLSLPAAAGSIAIGGLMGFVHGFVMSFILVAMVAEQHPVEQFQDAGFEVAAAHVIGHVTYGIGVAATTVLFAIDFGFRF